MTRSLPSPEVAAEPCASFAAAPGSAFRPYHQEASVTIYHGDCREILPMLGRFDLLLTDPPYGIAYDPDENKHANPNPYGHEKVHDDDKKFDGGWLLQYADKAIMWGANCYAKSLPEDPRWLAWDKVTQNGLDVRISEMELAWTNCVRKPRVFRHLWAGAYRASEQKSRLHPTQKPIQLMQWCIMLAGDVQTIVDPFAGSGTTGRAAKDLGKQCVLIEREERYCEIAARRLAQDVLPLGTPNSELNDSPSQYPVGNKAPKADESQ